MEVCQLSEYANIWTSCISQYNETTLHSQFAKSTEKSTSFEINECARICSTSLLFFSPFYQVEITPTTFYIQSGNNFKSFAGASTFRIAPQAILRNEKYFALHLLFLHQIIWNQNENHRSKFMIIMAAYTTTYYCLDTHTHALNEFGPQFTKYTWPIGSTEGNMANNNNNFSSFLRGDIFLR